MLEWLRCTMWPSHVSTLPVVGVVSLDQTLKGRPLLLFAWPRTNHRWFRWAKARHVSVHMQPPDGLSLLYVQHGSHAGCKPGHGSASRWCSRGDCSQCPLQPWTSTSDMLRVQHDLAYECCHRERRYTAERLKPAESWTAKT